MTANSREALRLLVAALEQHLEAVATRRSPEDAVVDDAYESVADAFERYEEALDLEFAEGLPIVLDEDDELGPVDENLEIEDDALDPHAVEDEDELDDDLDEFDLRS